MAGRGGATGEGVQGSDWGGEGVNVVCRGSCREEGSGEMGWILMVPSLDEIHALHARYRSCQGLTPGWRIQTVSGLEKHLNVHR